MRHLNLLYCVIQTLGSVRSYLGLRECSPHMHKVFHLDLKISLRFLILPSSMHANTKNNETRQGCTQKAMSVYGSRTFFSSVKTVCETVVAQDNSPSHSSSFEHVKKSRPQLCEEDLLTTDGSVRSLTLNIFSSVSLLISSLSNGCFSFTTVLHKVSRSPNSELDTPLETGNAISSLHVLVVSAAPTSIIL